MKLIWIIIPSLIFSVIGIQESLAEEYDLKIPSLEKYKDENSLNVRTNEILDLDITDGLNYLVQIDLIKLKQASNNDFVKLNYPTWIESVIRWWVDDKISDSDLLHTLGFMTKQELIYDTNFKNKIWIEFAPQQCPDDPPEAHWMKIVDDNPISEIKSHYKKLDIEVYDVKYQSSIDSIFDNCSAPYSGIWYLQISGFDLTRMQELGFSLVGRYHPDKTWDNVLVYTDKSFYNQGDVITVFIKNESDNSIFFSGGNIGIGISDVKGESLFPCIVQTSNVPELKPGAQYTRTYDVENSCQKEYLRSGVYRVFSEFFTLEDNKGQNYIKTDLVNIQFSTEKPKSMTISDIINNHDKLDSKLIITEGILSLNKLNEPIGFYNGSCTNHVPDTKMNYILDYRPTYVLSNYSDESIAIEVLSDNTSLDLFNLENIVDVILTGRIYTTELITDLCSDVKKPSAFIEVDYKKDQKIVDLSKYRPQVIHPHIENEK